MTKLQPSRAGVLVVVINRYSRTHVPNEPAVSKMTSVQKSAARRHTIPAETARNRGDESAYHSVDRCSKESFSFFFFRVIESCRAIMVPLQYPVLHIF